MRSVWQEFVRFFTSLRLTVVLLVLSIFLVLFATLNQVTLGIWAVQEKWFRSFIVLHEIKGIPVPVFPGGYFIGGLLLINLVASHIYRFRFSLKKSGILITHAGLILLLVGELYTGIVQEEFQMRLDEGQTRNYSESPREVELAVIDATDPATDTVVAIPAGQLARVRGNPARAIQHPRLPFTLNILEYFPNSALEMREANPAAPPSGANRDIGEKLALYPRPLTFTENTRNLPAALVELRGPGGASLGIWLASAWLVEPQTFDYAGRTWRLHMRFQREYHPWSLALIDFAHDTWIGTDIPKNFSSHLRLQYPARGEDREVLIYMNNPLRYDGLTFYQQGFDNNDTTTILQVVRNPGWMLPYISCVMLAAGLLIQFGIHLVGFARKRAVANRT
ncbi:ResB protein required for cytochrome c biosynthesis [Opitutaceae bacterium TAV1]|nr:ResB protein required for cytochrome c biosynthesis [Opitutaceae bacterium TAV1]